MTDNTRKDLAALKLALDGTVENAGRLTDVVDRLVVVVEELDARVSALEKDRARD